MAAESLSCSKAHSCLLTRMARLLRPLQQAMASGAFAAKAPSTIVLSAPAVSAVRPKDFASSDLHYPCTAQI